MFTVEYTKAAIKDLKKMDPHTRKLILLWIEKHLVDCDNPRVHGKTLKGDLQEFWRYRVGDYRLLCFIEDEKLIITTLRIGHRKEIYK